MNKIRTNNKEEIMCPACIATVAIAITSATSAGGLTAIALKKYRTKNNRAKGISNSNQKNN